MKKFVLCTLFLSAVTGLRAAIIYNASIGCQQTCVTVSLSWAGESFGVNYAQVENSHDAVIFSLELGSSAGQSTGSILPTPQTFSPISSSDIADISSGNAYLLITSIQPGLVGGQDGPTSDGTTFIAAQVPEPAAWPIVAAGLAVLLFRARRFRRAYRE